MIIDNIQIDTVAEFLAYASTLTDFTRYHAAKTFTEETGCLLTDLLSPMEIEQIEAQLILFNKSQLFIMTNSSKDPQFLDYELYGLDKVKTIVKGELVNVQYLREGELAVEESRVYHRNAYGVVQYKTTVVNWFKYGGTIGISKTWDKYYPPEDAIQEGVDRRNNIVNDVKFYLLDMLGQSYSFDMLLSMKTEIQYYLDGYRDPLILKVQQSTKPYLTPEIKLAVVEKLTF